MTEQEALAAALDRSSGLDQLHPNDAFGAGFHAALAWLRSQGKPVTVVGNHQELLRVGELGLAYIEPGTELYIVPQPAIPDGFVLVQKEIAAVLQAIIDDFDDGRGYTNLDDELADRARAALVLLAAVPQTAIPDGWRLVPVEPTQEMLRSAFCEAGGSYENKEGIYRAMLAAAPEPNK